MRRIIILVLTAIMLLSLASCSIKTETDVDEVQGIIGDWDYIEFWNGGGKIGEFKNCTIRLDMDRVTNDAHVAVFYLCLYDVYVNGRLAATITYSEAMSTIGVRK